MSDLDGLLIARSRLVDGEPIRILIGHALHSAVEIVPAAKFMTDLRAAFVCDIDERISETFAEPSAATGEAATGEGES